jgi:hypothetical protein
MTTPASPGVLHRSTAVSVDFFEFVPVTISEVLPDISGPACGSAFDFIGFDLCPSFYPNCQNPGGFFDYGCYNVYFAPTPPAGEQWDLYDAPVSVNIDTMTLNCNSTAAFADCDLYIWYLNLLGWSGVGPGSVSSSQPNITFNPTGPVTETATFQLTGECTWFYDSFGIPPLYLEGCSNLTAPLNVAEHGVPSGTSWGVSLSGAAGNGSVFANAPTEINVAKAGLGIAGVVPWSIPTLNPLDVWSAVGSETSPLVLPVTSTLEENYSRVPYTSLSEPVVLRTIGLPTGLNGNVSVTDLNTGTSTGFGVPSSGMNTTLPGGRYTVNASEILTTGGVGYTVAEVYVTSDLLNYSNQSNTAPDPVLLGAPTIVTVAYTTENWVEINAGVGGSVSPTSRWVPLGNTVTLHASADAGYHFLAWLGTGPGATGSSQATLPEVVIEPTGPVTELATFAVNGAPTWTVTVEPTGVPTGAEYTVTLGGRNYSGTGASLAITNLSTGDYALGFPTVSFVGTTIAEATLSSVTASSGLSGSTLDVSQNLTLSPVYQTQYLVSVTVVGSGTVSQGPGTFWEPSHSTLTIQAVPAAGESFVGWTGAFDGGSAALISNTTTLSVTMSGSLNVVARFVPTTQVLAVTFSLTVTETGLPSGVPWQFELNQTAFGAAGTTGSLAIRGLLGGNYQVVVPVAYGLPGLRYVPQEVPTSAVSVARNTSVTITFEQEDLVTVAASGNGTATGGGWYPEGTPVALTATSTGGTFTGWSGSGVGSYSGMKSSLSIETFGPVTETASFVPKGSTNAASTPATPMIDYIGVGLVVAVLLAVGIAEGYLMARKRRPPTAAPPPRPRAPPPTGAPPTRSLPPAAPRPTSPPLRPSGPS